MSASCSAAERGCYHIGTVTKRGEIPDATTTADPQRKVPSWDQYYLLICNHVASRSKDPNTQLGCVIVGPAHEIRSTGYNSLPRGIRDDVPERLQRPTKYLWMEHAERNAIYNAARAGTSTEGCSMYVQIMPCMDCARAIVQAGLKEVVISRERMSKYSSEQYDAQFRDVETLLHEANVAFRQVEAGESLAEHGSAPLPSGETGSS